MISMASTEKSAYLESNESQDSSQVDSKAEKPGSLEKEVITDTVLDMASAEKPGSNNKGVRAHDYCHKQ